MNATPAHDLRDASLARPIAMRQTFDTLVAQFYNKLTNYAEHISKADAEDLVQDTFLRAWRYFDKFDERRGDFYTFLRIQCRHIHFDKHRSAASRTALLSLDQELPPNQCLVTPDISESVISRRMLDDAMADMTASEKSIAISLMEGNTVQDTARALSLPPSALYHVVWALRDVMDTEMRCVA